MCRISFPMCRVSFSMCRIFYPMCRISFSMCKISFSMCIIFFPMSRIFFSCAESHSRCAESHFPCGCAFNKSKYRELAIEQLNLWKCENPFEVLGIGRGCGWVHRVFMNTHRGKDDYHINKYLHQGKSVFFPRPLSIDFFFYFFCNFHFFSFSSLQTMNSFWKFLIALLSN